MMKEQLVSFDVAKLAKELGFNYPSYTYYDFKGDECSHITNEDTNKSK